MTLGVTLITSILTASVALTAVILTVGNQRRLATEARAWEKRAVVYEEIVTVINSSNWNELDAEDILALAGRNFIYGSKGIVESFDQWWQFTFYHSLQSSGVDLSMTGDEIFVAAKYHREKIMALIRSEYVGKRSRRLPAPPPALGGPMPFAKAADDDNMEPES